MNQFMNPYLNPYGLQNYGQVQPSVMMPQMQTTPQQVVKVNGEPGARAYQMGPNSSALLLDESGLMVWVCTTDGASYKTVTAYDIVPHKEAAEPSYGDLESRVKTIEKRLEEIMNVNTKRTSSAGKKQSEDSTD